MKSLTLQVDPNNFLYWIQIGRGDNKEALETARKLENNAQIMLALMKYTDDIKADDKLSSDERQKQLEPLEKELEELKRTADEQKAKAEENQQANTEQNQADVEAAKAEKEKAEQEQAKKENKEKEDKKKKDDK